jgi:L-2-hydroxyglutarate oxidase LhgO
MREPTEVDFLVVGAGVVGCAIALKLREQWPDRSAAVIEKKSSAGRETSRFNSGVIHSGIHLPTEYLKARLASKGSKLVVEYCKAHDVTHKKVGMYVVVAPEDMFGLWGEIVHLRKMLKRARALKINVRLVSARTLRKREPHVRCVFALHIPDVHIIDPEQFVQTLEEDAQKHGAKFFYDEICTGFAGSGDETTVTTSAGEFRAKWVVNAAGLFAEEIARSAGFESDVCPSQAYFRGEYYEIDPESGISVKALVYPVHRPGKPGLGTHVTPRTDGRTLLGPNAVALESNQDYDQNRTPPDLFYRDVRPFLPKLEVRHLKQAYAGIRPKLGKEPGEKDFHISVGTSPHRMVNMIGIESPGLTASLAIAEYVVEKVAEAEGSDR